jgi:nucleoside-triphosphatase
MTKSIKIGITGMPGAGKTQSLVKTIELLEQDNKIVGGMITEPVVEGTRRVGFYVMNWLTKEKKIFAHITFKSKIVIGRFGVNIGVLEEVGVAALEQASRDADIIVIDEIGKMEVESEKFVVCVKRVLEVNKPMILTLHKKSRNPLLQDIRRRDDIRILEVTPINKGLLPYKILRLLKGELL